VTIHTYDNASITIGGTTFRNTSVEWGVDPAASDGEDTTGVVVGNTSTGTYEVTLTLANGRCDELDELAQQAVCTPSIGASDALDVLVDGLIARGRLDSPLQTFFAPEAWARRRREAAFEWAEDRTLGTFGRIMRMVEEAARQQAQALFVVPPTIETASGAWLDTIAEQMFGVQRVVIPPEGVDHSETDDELRARCRALLDQYRPPPRIGE
jgi:hypothetical protein